MSTLADREAGPMPDRLAFGPLRSARALDAYVQAFGLWAAIRRDAEMTYDELGVYWDGIAARLGFPGESLTPWPPR